MATNTSEAANVAVPRVLIADEDQRFRERLERAFGELGWTLFLAATGAEAQAVLSERNIDVLVADSDMPGNRQLELLEHAACQGGDTVAILTTAQASLATALRAIDLGVAGYLTKPVDVPRLQEKIQAACEGLRERRARGRILASIENLLHTFDASAAATTPRCSADALGLLSEREQEVALLVCEGVSVDTVASRLAISHFTVRNHLRSIYRKLGVTRQAGLVSKLLRG